MGPSKRRLPRPPYNPGVRDLVQAKRARDSRPAEGDQREGFRGWHERGYVPHRDSPGLTQFITYHLADALPTVLISEWTALLRIEDDRERRKELEDYLDRGRGDCWLRRPDMAEICENAFRHFDHERYSLKAWCLMPNHVHILVLITTAPMSESLQTWKGYTACQCNRILRRRDRSFWADGYWDTYMRNTEQEHRAMRYIENNPVRARLVREAKAWPWSSARFRDEYGALQCPALE